MRTGKILYATAVIILMIIISGCSSENKLLREKFISGGYKMIVCPVHLLDRQSSIYDGSLSKKIVDYMNERKYADASQTELCPPPNINWQGDQAVMVDNSIELFKQFIVMNRVPAKTFVFYAEFLRGGKDARVVGVHYYLLDSKGEIAMRGILNSHSKEFKEVKPATNEECLRVLMDSFESKMME